MRNDDRFIPGEEIKDVAQWQFSAIQTAAQLLQAQVREREAQQMDASKNGHHQQAYQDGFAAGLQHGKQVAAQTVQQQMQDFLAHQAQDSAQRLAQLFKRADAQLQEVEQALAQGTLALACEVARHVVRRELVLDSQSVLPVLKEALGLLESQYKTALVRLHPTDLQALGELILAEFPDGRLSLRADASLQPGDCVVESAGTVVDGTLAKRWQQAVATLGLASTWETADDDV